MRGRTAMVAATAAALVATGAGAADAGEYTYNENGSAVIVDGSYERDGVYGYVSAWQEQNREGRVYFGEQSGDWAQCAGQGTKKTSDDVFGWVGTLTYGEGPATVTTAGRYATGSATGTVEAYRDVVNDCTHTYTTTYVGALPVGIDLAGTGAVITTRDRGRYHVPSQFNDHYSYSFTGRDASGTATVDGVTSAANGVVGKTSWTFHTN